MLKENVVCEFKEDYFDSDDDDSFTLTDKCNIGTCKPINQCGTSGTCFFILKFPSKARLLYFLSLRIRGKLAFMNSKSILLTLNYHC